jgi:CHAT domain-containing protein
MAARIVGPTAQVISGSGATESAFKRLQLGDYRMLHLAMHGVADRRFPDRSALVFAGGGAAADDGLLQPREIMALAIRADLVTLSACETAAGKIQGIEGVASLVRAFLLAGARGVVASLWRADDRFTAALMTRFYRHLSAGAEAGEALRSAKLDLIRRYGDRAHPYYWAGFTLTGDSVRVAGR